MADPTIQEITDQVAMFTAIKAAIVGKNPNDALTVIGQITAHILHEICPDKATAHNQIVGRGDGRAALGHSGYAAFLWRMVTSLYDGETKKPGSSLITDQALVAAQYKKIAK